MGIDLAQEPSANFAFLAYHDARLVAVATAAERLFPIDAAACLTKLRLFLELLVKRANARIGLYVAPEDKLVALIHRLHDERAIDVRVKALMNDLRRVATRLRDHGQVSYKRLRKGGGLYAAINSTIAMGLKLDYFDRPHRAQVRSILTDPKSYTPTHWRAVLLASLDGTPTDRTEALHTAATWAAENTALQFRRLRKDGTILKSLKSALTHAVRHGDVERVDSRRVARNRI